MKNLFTEMKKLMLLVAGMIFIVPACTNLDEELYSDLAAENFFTTEEENIAALGQAYSSMTHWGNHFNIWTANELSSDELVIPTRGGDWYDGGILLQLHEHRLLQIMVLSVMLGMFLMVLLTLLTDLYISLVQLKELMLMRLS